MFRSITVDTKIFIIFLAQGGEARKSGGEKLRRGVESEHFPRVIVDPVCGLLELFPGDFLKVRPFHKDNNKTTVESIEKAISNPSWGHFPTKVSPWRLS